MDKWLHRLYGGDSGGTCRGGTGRQWGATPAHALGAGIVAIDAIATGCAEVGNIDQRSASRDTNCDIGSFEAGRILGLVSFAEATSVVFEGSGLHRVAVRVDNRSGNLTSGELTLYLRVMGTAAPGADYTLLTGRPVVVSVPPAGVLSTTDLEFDILDDDEFEGDESITLKLTLVGPAGLGNNEHVVTIRDNEGNNVCSVAQAEVQQTVGDFTRSRYRNKGAQMKLVNQVLKSIEQSNGELPEGCRGCIVSQFARGILIADQAACTSSYPGQ